MIRLRLTSNHGVAPCEPSSSIVTRLQPAWLTPRSLSWALDAKIRDGDLLAAIDALAETGALRPVIDRVFPFEESAAALAYVESGRAKGKGVIALR